MASPRVLIVGAGPAGLVAALSLIDAGVASSEILVVERRPYIAKRWNTVQLAGFSLSRFDSWRAPDGTSVLASMDAAGVLGHTEGVRSHMENREGKPRSERGETEDIANPCRRVVQLKLDIGRTEFDPVVLKSQPGQTYRQVNVSMRKCWRAAYICDIEEHLMRIVRAKGVVVALACTTKLVWNAMSETYSARITRGKADAPHFADVPVLSLGEEVEVKPQLVVVAEGGARNMLKTQGVLARHRVEVKMHSKPKYFAAAIVRHPYPSRLIPTGHVYGGTFYFGTPDQYAKSIAMVSGNVIQRAPKYAKLETEGRECPPDVWYLRVPNDDLTLERLSNNNNAQDFGIVSSQTSPAMMNWVETHIRRIMNEFLDPAEVAQAEFVRVAAPFTQTDTVLEKCAMGKNLVVFGDAARTGHFVSGMGMNTVIAMDSYAITQLWKPFSTSTNADPALAAYSDHMISNARQWHRGSFPFHRERWPIWVPDSNLPDAKPGEVVPRTVLTLNSIDALERYIVGNLLLRYAVPVTAVRKGIRWGAEAAFGGVKREEYLPGVSAKL